MLQFQQNTVEQALAQALQFHQAGRLGEAEALYRQILAAQPQHADATHLLGVLACQVKRYDVAIELISQAIALNPRHPAYYSNIGEAYRLGGQLARALECYPKAVALDARFGDGYTNWGMCLFNEKRYDEAAEVFRAAVRHIPERGAFHRHLADMLVKLKRVDEAIGEYQQAVRLEPGLHEAWFNLALALASQGRPAEGAAAHREALKANPNDADVWMGLGDCLGRTNEFVNALNAYGKVIELNPPAAKQAEAYAAQAHVWRAADRVDDAIKGYRKALELKPDWPLTQANLAFALRDYGMLDEALSLLEKAVAADPESAPFRSAYLFTMYLDARITPERIEAEQAIWNEMHVKPRLAELKPHTNDRSPERRLKVGYVSADLRVHPVGRFMGPLLANHDAAQVETFCYSVTNRPDATTEELKKKAHQWRPVAGLSEEDLAEQIRADGIDILVDLSLHAIDNKMLTFARKPAPVQMTYLAYCAGSGLETMDYRLTDRWIDPVGGTSDGRAFERPLRLETYWCYGRHPAAGEVKAAPLEKNGYITFGSFNYSSKVNREVLALWAELLRRVPESRLVLHVPMGSRQDYVRGIWQEEGIALERVTLLPRTNEQAYFEQYGLVDVALDPFPFAGGTTTCDALYMGVPVVTLMGDRTTTRGGASVLSTLGLTELVAHSREEYLAIAEGLGRDAGRVAALRKELRGRMEQSVLMDAGRFARNVEGVYRDAWRRWCQGHA